MALASNSNFFSSSLTFSLNNIKTNFSLIIIYVKLNAENKVVPGGKLMSNDDVNTKQQLAKVNFSMSREQRAKAYLYWMCCEAEVKPTSECLRCFAHTHHNISHIFAGTKCGSRLNQFLMKLNFCLIEDTDNFEICLP